MMQKSSRVLLLFLLLSGCQTAGSTAWIAERLFFGRNIPAGGIVSDADWDQFLRTVITPRFPKGLTVWKGNGQWLDPHGDLVTEPVFVVEVFHKQDEEVETSMAMIAAEYKKRFGQDAVLRVTSPSAIRFY
jgi:hypothetical protein